jgi:hypothetical protein
MYHDNTRICSTDNYFVCGGNPDGNGGGVIASSHTIDDAKRIQLEAIKLGYVGVRILTWDELNKQE